MIRSIEVSKRPIGFIDGENFPEFLMGNPDLTGNRQQFSKVLDLKPIQVVQNMLYDAKVSGFVLSEEHRANILQVAKQQEELGFPNHASYYENLANTEDAVERLSIVYRSFAGRFSYTEPEFGLHGEVTSKMLGQIFDEGGQPLIDLHTHPQDVLPSPQDCVGLITGDSKGVPILRARMILCPSVQLLAVATNKTVWYPPLEAKKIVDSYDGTKIYGEEEDRVEEKFQFALRTQKRLDQASFKILSRSLENMRSYARYYNKGYINLEELQTLSEKVRQESGKNQKRITRLVDSMLVPAQLDLFSFEQYARNKGHLEMLEEFGIKLYISDNRRTFFAFSA